MRVRIEAVLLALLVAYAVWLPLPSASVTADTRLPLIVPPLVLCAAAASVHYTRIRRGEARTVWTFPHRIWTIGSILFIAVVVFQLLPLPPAVLRSLSPSTYDLWAESANVARLAGAASSQEWRPLTLDA